MIPFLIEPELRGCDAQGCGHYGASRGKRKHRGVDWAVKPNQKIYANVVGRVSKIGYPYNPSDKAKGFLRYLEIVDTYGNQQRFFYIKSNLRAGALVQVGTLIGTAQNLTKIYANMTNHIHHEVKSRGKYINPETL